MIRGVGGGGGGGVRVMYARGEPNGIQNHHPASGLETNVFQAARQNA